MRDISLDEQPSTQPFNTFLVYGDTRTGKTTFAGSFPRPVFFSDASEQGWESLKYLSDAQLFEANVNPIVWAISEMNDMAIAVERVKPLIASGRCHTIVVDSISFYADLYLNYMFTMNPGDTRAAYGALGVHLRDLRVKIHNLGVNVVWLALAKHPEKPSDAGGPLIPGQQADKFAAGCNFIFHSRVQVWKDKGVITAKQHEMRTAQYGTYIAGSRLGATATELPDPLVGTYDDFLKFRDFDPDAIRKTFKPPLPIAKWAGLPAVAPPPVIAKPAAKTK